MGLIICDKHKACGIAHNILKELVRVIKSDEDLENDNLEILEEKLNLGEYGYENLKYLVTTQFIIENNLSKSFETNETNENSINDKIYSKMGVICVKCLREYVKKRKLKKGKLFDFMNFETTSRS